MSEQYIPIYDELTTDYNNAIRRMFKKKIDFKRGRVNTVRFKGHKRHAFIKSMICKALRDENHHLLTEAEFPNGKVADIYDASTDTVIEIETHASDSDKDSKMDDFAKYVSELFIIDPVEWPADFLQVYKKAADEFCP